MKRCVKCRHLNEDAATICEEDWHTEFEPVGDQGGQDRDDHGGEDRKPPPEKVASLRLDFDGGWFVELGREQEARLGRDPAWSRYAGALSDHPHVSARHATVGVRSDGRSWIRDERSMNGTFHNGVRIAAGAPCPLTHGDTVKLSTRLTARVSRPAEAGDRA